MKSTATILIFLLLPPTVVAFPATPESLELKIALNGDLSHLAHNFNKVSIYQADHPVVTDEECGKISKHFDVSKLFNCAHKKIAELNGGLSHPALNKHNQWTEFQPSPYRHWPGSDPWPPQPEPEPPIILTEEEEELIERGMASMEFKDEDEDECKVKFSDDLSYHYLDYQEYVECINSGPELEEIKNLMTKVGKAMKKARESEKVIYQPGIAD